jgi:YD repeat-containing protein
MRQGRAFIFTATVLVFASRCYAQSDGSTSSPTASPQRQRNESRNVVHDAFGRLIAEIIEHDADSDGKMDRRSSTKFTYNERAQLASKVIEFEDQLGSTTVRRETVTFEYDGDGRLIEETQVIDNNGDDRADSRSVSKFTYNDTKMATKSTDHDKEADGKFDSSEKATFRYDGKGDLAQEIIDRDADNDGISEQRVVSKFSNERGKLVKKTVESDVDMDGRVDNREVSTFKNSAGSRSSVETIESDRNADGIVDQRDVVLHNVVPLSDGGTSRYWIIAANAVIVLVLIVIAVYRRIASRSRSQATT